VIALGFAQGYWRTWVVLWSEDPSAIEVVKDLLLAFGEILKRAAVLVQK
jgi:hypothetical protein